MPIATVTIGEHEIEIPELNFKSLKRIFPLVKEMKMHSPEDVAANPELAFAAVDDTIKILSIALERSSHPMTPEQIEEELTTHQMGDLQPALTAILTSNGLVGRKGEPKPVTAEAGEAKLSTETLTESSAKSSQDSTQSTGT